MSKFSILPDGTVDIPSTTASSFNPDSVLPSLTASTASLTRSDSAALLKRRSNGGAHRSRRHAATNVLKPLLGRQKAKPKRLPNKPLEGLEPWEIAELQHLKDLQDSTFSSEFGSSLLDLYVNSPGTTFVTAEPSAPPSGPSAHEAAAEFLRTRGKRPVPAASLRPFTSEKLPKHLQSQLSAPSTPKAGEESVVQAAMAMSLPEPRKPSKTTHNSSKKVTPLMLPGMKVAPPVDASVDDSRGSTRSTASRSIQLAFQMQGLVQDAETDRTQQERKSSVVAPGASWATVCPFLKFLKKHRKHHPHGSGDGEDIVHKHQAERKHTEQQSFGYRQHESDPAPPIEMHAKTAGMVDSLQQWLATGKGGKQPNKEPSGNLLRSNVAMADDLTNGGDKAEWRGLIIVAKKYNLPINDVRDYKFEFDDLLAAMRIQTSVGHISREDFLELIRKRCNIRDRDEIPIQLLTCIPSDKVRIDFEDFVKWSILTAWCEETLMPDPDGRHIRKLAREQKMLLPDVERIKRLFDEFDTDGSGEIEEEEFRHILYRMLRVKNTTDIPLKRLQRYWREVDLDGSGNVGFDEFLIWFKTSFAKNGKLNL